MGKVSSRTMPNRIIREGILDSKRVAELSDGAELFYRKLMSVVDDHGRYQFDLEILRIRLYPRKLAAVSDEQVRGYLRECCAGPNPLVVAYTEQTKSYLEVQHFEQRLRATVSKYPDPFQCVKLLEYHPLVEVDGHMAANWQSSARLARASTTHTTTPMTLCYSEEEGPGGRNQALAVEQRQRPLEAQQRAWFAEFWPKYWRRSAREAAWRAFEKHVTTPQLFETVLRAVEAQTAMMMARADEHRPHASTWINQHRWEDEAPAPATPAARDGPHRFDRKAAANREFEERLQEKLQSQNG